MSPSNNACSSVTPSGIHSNVESASGTRTNSACPPCSPSPIPTQPNSCPVDNGCEARAAVRALTAVGRKWAVHAIADRQTANIGASFDNLSDKLVPHDGADVETLLALVVGVQVGPAQAGDINLHYDVAGSLDLGIRDGLVNCRAIATNVIAFIRV